jgi:pimeloyl-ACP methyl ester carboxylesterase
VPQAKANGIEIEYVTEGDPSDPALLLVMGLGAQLTTWPDGFVDGLRQRGFFVIRYDNRDSGLSTKFDGLPDIAALFTGTDLSSVAYRIEDMADDGAALLAALGIAKAHVVGASMGGMITQALVINHPELFLSACSIMSTTGDRAVGAPTGDAMTALLCRTAHLPGHGA